MKKLLLVFVVICCISACKYSGKVPEFRHGGTNDGYFKIDLDINNATYIEIDSIVKEIKYIPLETNENCLIGSYDKVIFVNDTIYILDRFYQKTVFVFNFNGEFLYKISAIGRGPEEYIEAHDFYVDTVDSHIGILDHGRIQKYDFSGHYIGQVKFEIIPTNISIGAGKFNAVALERFSRKQSKIFVQYNSEGNIIYSDHPTSNSLLDFEMTTTKNFSSNKKGNYFNYFGSDTIYRITDSFLKPEFALDYGKSALLPHIREQLLDKSIDNTWSFFRDNQDIVMYGLSGFSLSDDFLLLDVPYGMSLKKVFFSLNSQEIKFLRNASSHLSTLYPKGIQLTDDGLIGIINSSDVHRAKMIRENNLSKQEMNNLFFYKNIPGFDNITELDNDIICIFSLKDF